MKKFRFFLTATLICVVSLSLVSCQQEQVKPKGQPSPSLALGSEDPHPTPDPVCSPLDTIYLRSEDGSSTITYCNGFPCPSGMPNWGFAELLNGRDIMIANFTLATGWFIDVNRSRFSSGGNWNFNQNGLPVIGNDWIVNDLSPVVNKWQLAVYLNDLPNPCFELAMNITAVRLDFFTGVDQNSATELWGWNPNWNVNGHPSQSTSPYVTTWCPTLCPNPEPEPDSTCVVAYPGLPNNAGCIDLSPDASDAVGTTTYAWSTGATTESINVCPTEDTDYTVTVTDENGPFSVTTYNVLAEDIICTPGNRPSPKVLVCHYPPGNPNNPRTICIDWSGVPAHVAAYRTEAHNPNHGHDSGCHLGPCHSNPCAE